MIKQSIKYFSHLLLFWMTLFTLDRILFILYNVNELEISIIKKIEPIWQGLRLDLATACYLSLPIFIIWVISLFFYLINSQKIIKTYFILIIPMLVFGIILNLEIYDKWGHQINSDTVSYLKYPREAWASSLNSPLILLLSLFTVVTFLFLKWSKYISELNWQTKEKKASFNIKKISIKTLKGLIAFIIYGLCMRGGVQLSPINQSFAYYSKESALNAAAVNTIYNYIYSATQKNHINPYKYFSENEIDSFLFKEDSKVNKNIKIISTEKPNIVLIIMEGLAAEILFSEEKLTPNMNRLIKRSLYFENIYATSTRTDRGLVSILSGYPSLPNISVVKEPEKAAQLSFLSKEFKRNGYSTSFIYGGESEFANIKSYLLNSKFDKIIDKNNFQKKDMNSKWGAHDHIVFNESFIQLKNIEEPFFTTILTLSSHEPFEVPMETIIKGNDRQSLYKNSVMYLDRSIGSFMDKVSTQKYYDNTVFIFISDHGFRVGDTMNRDKKRYHIPFFIYGSPLNNKWIGKKIAKVGSQSDLPKTILNQLNFNSDQFNFSNDIFIKKALFAQYTFSHGFGVVSDKQSLIYDYDTKDIQYSNKKLNANNEFLFNFGKAYLQKAYQDFIDKK
jgi:phosphoglycerol transferase MdoB-like AlkP superfamily enzyme